MSSPTASPRSSSWSSSWSSALADPDILLGRWRQHVAVLVRSALPAVAAAVAAGVVGRGRGPGTILWVPTLVLALRLAWKAAMWWLGWVILTNRQILRVSGLLRHQEVLPLSYVTTFTCRHSVLGRLLGYADWILEAPGHGPMRIGYVPHAQERYVTLRRLMAGGEVTRII